LALVASVLVLTLTPSALLGPLKPTEFSFATTASKSPLPTRPYCTTFLSTGQNLPTAFVGGWLCTW